MDEHIAQPSPILFFETVNAYQRTAALKAAIELDVFTALAEVSTTAQAVAARCRTSERGMRILLDYLVIIGLLTKAGEQYALTPDSALFLDRNKPSYLGGTIEFLLAPEVTGGFDKLSEAVRQGRTAVSDEGTMEPENPIWVRFARAMVPMVMMSAQAIAQMVRVAPDRPVKVLDVAAGHGIFGITLAQANPNVEVVALDWPNVLEVARENAQRFGVGDRHTLLPGSAFDVDWGSGYDLVLLTNFFHHFDPPTCEQLMKQTHAALNEGGRVVTLEFVPNEDRVTPPTAAAFSIMMLSGTAAGDAYTAAEYEQMFRHAGFARSEVHPLPGSPQTVIVSQK